MYYEGEEIMKDYTKTLPKHIEKYIGENDLFIELFEVDEQLGATPKRPPLIFVHGAYTGSWMWSKFIPHFVSEGWKCYVMNMRSHYRSRAMDLTKVSFEDYLEDIKEIIAECGETPIVVGFSMGGILCQKLAETEKLAGMILVDSSVSREVNKIAPYNSISEITLGIVAPAPEREENSSIDESEDDIAFQRKYLAMESSKAMNAFSFGFGAKEGISIDGSLITCPCLVIKAVNSNDDGGSDSDSDDDKRGRAMTEQLNADYTLFCNTTHTGLLVGQRYNEVVDRIMEWLKRF
jgi:pimeloyl-ACP methyl ester carboxylesterase